METQFKIALFFLFLNLVLTQQVSLSSEHSERLALLELRSSLGIRARYWPRKAIHCLDWTGIECKNGLVTGIMLSGLRRSRHGRLFQQFAVDSLSKLTQLVYFNSSGFALPGPIPDWFGQRLGALQVLDLSSSSIIGSVPASLGSMSRLSYVSLSSNSITGTIPADLGKLSSLLVLNLSGNSLTGSIPISFSALENLTVLDLSSNFLSGPIPVEFGSLRSLKFFKLSNNSLSASIPAQLADLSQLVELDVGYNYLSGSLPEELGRLRSLRKLLVGKNELEGVLPNALFSNVSQLECIVLSWNKFEGKLPDVMWSLSHLRFIDVSGNNFTGVLSNLTYFNVTGASYNLSNNLLYGNLTLDPWNFQSIDLSYNYLQGLAPNYTGISIQVRNNCFTRALSQRSSEDCSKFYAERGLVYVDCSGNCSSQTTPEKCQKSGKRRMYIMIGVFGGLGVLVIMALAIVLFLKTCYRGTVTERGAANVNPVTEGEKAVTAKESKDLSVLGESFTYEEILVATSNFSEANLIKHGDTGDFFLGILEGRSPIVIKKVNVLSLDKELYELELDLLNKIKHHRLVPLLGHCLEHENEKFLVYKYMPNGDLYTSLSRGINSDDEDLQSLDWITRLKIASGAAEVLAYFHHECNPPLVHRDVQASSILLDDKYEVRMGSLCKVCVQEGDNQNMITRFLRMPGNSEGDIAGSPSTSCSYDVYCFGKVLLELVTGKLGISHSDDASTKEWLDKHLPFISTHDKELVTKIIDQSLIIDEDLLEEIWAVAIVAKSCLNPRPTKRPLMKHILRALENPFKVVREESFSSGRLRTASSRRSWSAAFLGSWRQSSSEIKECNTLKLSGRVGSHSSGNEHSSSYKKSSSEIFPEPVEMQDTERQDMS